MHMPKRLRSRYCCPSCSRSRPYSCSLNANIRTPREVADKKFLQLDNINPHYEKIDFAIRGPISARANEIEKELKRGVPKRFEVVVRCNIGDAQSMGQKPFTFVRQLIALTVDPSLMEKKNLYPPDIIKRARAILDQCHGNSIGTYTDTLGLELIRRQVAEFISARDGVPSDYRNIILTAGSTDGIRRILDLINCTMNCKPAGVMVPIPEYPLYSATLSEYGMYKIGYYLEEETGWSLSHEELERAYNESLKKCNPRAIIANNPGNPAGQVFTREVIEDIIKFAYRHKLLIMADEVYQDDIWDDDAKFFSFKKVLIEMGEPYNKMELVSFHSTSKSFFCECGLRGGYMEIVNFLREVFAMLVKSLVPILCSPTIGQVTVSAMVNPPKEGEPSYPLFMEEKANIMSFLKGHADLLFLTLNGFEGYRCNRIMGSLYTFPRITLPPKAIAAAKKLNVEPDYLYASEFLEFGGICVVPGSGFGQKPGTYHFRGSIIPQFPLIKAMMLELQKFHTQFLEKYK